MVIVYYMHTGYWVKVLCKLCVHTVTKVWSAKILFKVNRIHISALIIQNTGSIVPVQNWINTIHMYSGITSDRVLDGELLCTKILEVNLFAFAKLANANKLTSGIFV